MLRNAPPARPAQTDESQQQTTTHPIQVSHHADLRWVQRAREFSTRPATGWRRARPVRLEGAGAGFSRVRYDPETETLLCVTDGTLTTVLYAEHETFQPAHHSQESSSVECAGCGRQRQDTTSPCPECGTRAVIGDHTDSLYTEGEFQ